MRRATSLLRALFFLVVLRFTDAAHNDVRIHIPSARVGVCNPTARPNSTLGEATNTVDEFSFCFYLQDPAASAIESQLLFSDLSRRSDRRREDEGETRFVTEQQCSQELVPPRASPEKSIAILSYNTQKKMFDVFYI